MQPEPIKDGQQVPKSPADVDRIVLEKLSDPNNPDNWHIYDLAGPGSLKTKFKVVMKATGMICLFVAAWVIGEALDEAILHTRTTGRIPVPIFTIVILFAVLVLPVVIKARRDLRK